MPANPGARMKPTRFWRDSMAAKASGSWRSTTNAPLRVLQRAWRSTDVWTASPVHLSAVTDKRGLDLEASQADRMHDEGCSQDSCCCRAAAGALTAPSVLQLSIQRL